MACGKPDYLSDRRSGKMSASGQSPDVTRLKSVTTCVISNVAGPSTVARSQGTIAQAPSPSLAEGTHVAELTPFQETVLPVGDFAASPFR